MTSIKGAKQILSRVTEALAAGRLVLMTDGTVTRKIIQMEITTHGLKSTLDVQVEITGWLEIPIIWPWDELTGYGLTELGDELYLAPDWWIAL